MSASASACSPSPPHRALGSGATFLLAPEVLLAHEVLAFVVANRQRLHGLPGALGARLVGAATSVVLRLAARDPAAARVATHVAAIALQAAVALGALTGAEAARPRGRLVGLRRALARPARAA